MFTGDIRPHYYCLPVAKRERHRLALRKAATPGAACFFLGTDTARLARHAKEAACGCAGMFVTPVALQCYAQVFDEEHALGHLEAFASLNGPRFYSLPTNGGSSPSSGGASRSSRRRRLGRSTIGSCPSWPVSIQLGRWGALENGDERCLSRPRSRRRADRAHAVRGARCSRELGQPLHPRRGLGEAGLHRLPPADRVPASAGRAETAGIPFAASIADRLMLPMQYVGKHPLAIGRNAQVERIVGEGARTLLVDDLATDGRCKVGFVRGLCEAGAQVQHILVILYHAVFPGTAERLRQLEVELHPLATWVDVLRVAAARNYLDGSTCAKLERFFADPAAWSAAHGRAAAPAPLIGHD